MESTAEMTGCLQLEPFLRSAMQKNDMQAGLQGTAHAQLCFGILSLGNCALAQSQLCWGSAFCNPLLIIE